MNKTSRRAPGRRRPGPILDTAQVLFDAHGLHAVGADLVIARARSGQHDPVPALRPQGRPSSPTSTHANERAPGLVRASIDPAAASHTGAVTCAEVVVDALPGAAVRGGRRPRSSARRQARHRRVQQPRRRSDEQHRRAHPACAWGDPGPGHSTRSAGRTSPTPTSTAPPQTCCGAVPMATPAFLSQRSSPTSASTPSASAGSTNFPLSTCSPACGSPSPSASDAGRHLAFKILTR